MEDLMGFVAVGRAAFGAGGSRRACARRRPRCCADAAEGGEEPFVLKVGDLAVHEKYGIGRFVGVQRSRDALGAGVQEFAVLDYRDGDLLVPVTQLDRLSRVTQDTGDSRLDNLNAMHAFEDTSAVRRQRARRVQKDRAKIRKRVLDLQGMYASRNKLKRPPVPITSHAHEDAFDRAFPYKLTSGQVRALRDIMYDLSVNERPMDRLLCGDVGFGKTEVAFRAALRVLLAGRQVAVLCPTTILASQHYQKAVERFASVSDAVSIGRLTRFVPKKEQQETAARLRDGSINFVIGTHSILSKAIEFRNLGLLIIDEEHRFGVCQKEQIREQSKLLDILFLSATPIPRTLHMSMNGLRDVSVIKTPPENRLPIKTMIGPWGNGTVRHAIGAELARGGQVAVIRDQVFYVLRQIREIEKTASWIRSLFPDHRVLMAHAQLKDLEKRITFFAEGGADILVCTTIIETGIDMPEVNTIIIDEPAHLGLAQLHQLRGRVGRGERQGYAWLLYKGSKDAISERLRILKRCSGLGSGFEVAKRDLELRGMGSVLGVEQSGKGSGLEPAEYARILAEEIALAKQTELEVLPPLPEVATTELYLPVSSQIPPDYIRDDELRLEAYFQLARAASRDELTDQSNRLARIWGEPMPVIMQQFIALLEVKMLAKALGITRVYAEKSHVVLDWAIAARTVNFLRCFIVDERDAARFDCTDDNGQVVLRGLGMMSGDVQIAKLRQWLRVFVKCVEDMREAERVSRAQSKSKNGP